MVKIVLDTSVVIEKIRKRGVIFDNLIEDMSQGKCELLISVVVLTELWMGESMRISGSISDVEKILQPIRRLGIDERVAKLAGELIREKKSVGLDALIAATCVEYGAELATLNTKHFKNIKGLRLYNENL